MKWLYFSLILAFAGLSVILHLREEEPLVLITHPRVYSFYYSDPLERIRLDVLSNKTDDFRLYVDYVEQVEIANEETSLAFQLDRISIGEPFQWDNQTMAVVSWYLAPEVVLSNSQIDIKQANLIVTYGNGSQVTLAIGDVHYLFSPSGSSSMALGGVKALYEDIDGIESVSAIQVDLVNRTNDILHVTNIALVASAVSTYPAMIRTDVTCEDGWTVADCLGLEGYVFDLPAVDEEISVLLTPHQTRTILVPLLYERPTPFHRFAIVVSYRINGIAQQMVIDDFPYLSTSPFQVDYEPWYVRHVID